MEPRTPGAAPPTPEEFLGEAVEAALDRYRAGLCNIGRRERILRLIGGAVAAAATGAAWVAMRRRGLPPSWRLALGAPAFAATVGLEQARAHFCVANALRGVSKMGDTTQRVEEAAARRADREYAAAILTRCALIAALVAIAAFIL